MRVYGLFGCILYIMFFASILYWLYKKKVYRVYFLVSMILGAFIPGFIYLR